MPDSENEYQDPYTLYDGPMQEMGRDFEATIARILEESEE